jgi:uncharacterized Zn finger protein (UPF0148 family)
MSETCEVCGCPLSCPICDDASEGLVNDIDQLQQQRDHLQAENQRLKEALEELIKLQSHYATLLNGYDDGCRHPFESAEEWMDRLEELKRVEEVRDE